MVQEDHRRVYSSIADVAHPANGTRIGRREDGDRTSESNEGRGLNVAMINAWQRFLDQENPEDRWIKWSLLFSVTIGVFYGLK